MGRADTTRCTTLQPAYTIAYSHSKKPAGRWGLAYLGSGRTRDNLNLRLKFWINIRTHATQAAKTGGMKGGQPSPVSQKCLMVPGTGHDWYCTIMFEFGLTQLTAGSSTTQNGFADPVRTLVASSAAAVISSTQSARAAVCASRRAFGLRGDAARPEGLPGFPLRTTAQLR